MLSITMPKKSRMMRFLLWFRMYPGIIMSARVGNVYNSYLSWSIFRRAAWNITIICINNQTIIRTTNVKPNLNKFLWKRSNSSRVSANNEFEFFF